MKKVLVTLSVAAFAASVFAQGTVQLVNNGTGFKAPIYGPEAPMSTVSKSGNTAAGLPAGTQTYAGALLTGSNYRAQLFGGTAADSLAAATPVSTFRTGTAAGYITGVNAAIPGVALDAPSAFVQVRAWDNTSGLYADWTAASAAWNAGLIAAGMSQVVSVDKIGGQANTPPIATALQSFNIYFQPIPEPSTMALAGLGAAALLIFRRRK